jgi:hypothetical protein
MDSELLYILALIFNFIGMAFSLWFAIYILARSDINHFAFRAIAALLAMAFYFYCAFTWIVDPSVDTAALRSFAIVIALVAGHDLTFYLLPEDLRKKRYLLARGIVLFSVGIIVLLFLGPSVADCDPSYTCLSPILSVWLIIDIFKILVAFFILSNLWMIKKHSDWVQNKTFTLGVLLALSAIGYGFISVLISTELPRFVPAGLVVAALGLLGYSVARHQAFVTRRTAPYDFPITLATIAVILIIYILIGRQLDLSLALILLLAVLVIFTHSAYDFVREILDRMFHSRERKMLRELRELGQDTFGETSLKRYLSRGLAILCYNLDASSGFIAVRRMDQAADRRLYEVMTSLHSLAVGTRLPPDEIVVEEIHQPRGYLAEDVEWLAPAYGGGAQVALIGVGPRKGQRVYMEEDLYWLEDIADEIGAMVYTHWLARDLQLMDGDKGDRDQLVAELEAIGAEHLMTAIAYKPDPEMIKCVEEGFRNIHDYSALGKSPLVARFGVSGEDHIERGKQVQKRLVEILEKLRPHGQPPSEPLPREWYSYTILYDAYVEEKPAREIMGKLYISEGTYYRTRRKALRGVTRALLEVEALS